MSRSTAKLLRPCKSGAFYPRSSASTRGLSCRNTLRALAPRQFPFIGVIGSKAKAAVLRRELMADGLAPALAETFHCSVGLDFGTNHRHKIALSIAAPLLTERRAQKRNWPRPRPRPKLRPLPLRITPSVLPSPSIHRSALASS